MYSRADIARWNAQLKESSYVDAIKFIKNHFIRRVKWIELPGSRPDECKISGTSGI